MIANLGAAITSIRVFCAAELRPVALTYRYWSMT